jgi:putative oxidoreductase
LSSVGFPFGVALAWFVTLLSMVCSVAMIIRRLVAPACIGHILILVVGIVLDHAHDGWFVVGGGRNGMEYSVTLISCLFAVLWAYWPRRQDVKPAGKI